VGFRNYKGEREGLSQKDRNYKEQIRKFMELRGYSLVKDSHTDSILSDMVFRRVPDMGETEILLEAKDTKLSLSDDDFAREIGSYYKKYRRRKVDQRFRLFIVASGLAATNRWKKVFEEEKWDQDEITKLKSEAKSKSGDDGDLEWSEEAFKEFLGDSTLIQADYLDLKAKIDELERKQGFDPSKFYIQESEVMNEKDKIKSNLVKVARYPQKMLSAEHKKINDIRTFYSENKAEPVALKFHKLHSIQNFNLLSNSITKYKKENSEVETSSFKEWLTGDQDEESVAKEIFRKYVIQEAKENGFSHEYYRGRHILYREHPDMDESENKVQGWKFTRVYEDRNTPVVRHKSIELDIKMYNDEMYLAIAPSIVFSYDGQNLIKNGKTVSKLHDSIGSNYDTNDRVLNLVEMWYNRLKLHEDKLAQKRKFKTTKPISMELGVRPIKSTKERDEAEKNRRLDEIDGF
jgi:hypothetical protein